MPMPVTMPLPREIIKWLQSLDLSFSVKNPKRDFTNGFLVAEILSRYYPKEVDMNSFDNGTRLAAKVDNWEQIYKLFRRKGLNIAKQEFDPVIHCAPGAALAFLLHLFAVLTKRAVRLFQPEIRQQVPPFMRDTASKRLKDHEIARIDDNVERTVRAIDVLGNYHEERRALKAVEAPVLIRQERRLRMGLPGKDLDTSSKDDQGLDSMQVAEVRVKAMTGAKRGLQGKADPVEAQQKAATSVKSLQKVVTKRTSVAALAGMQPPAHFVKPAFDIMRPLVFSIVQESEELSKMIDPKKDIVVSFMEQCREGIPYMAGRDGRELGKVSQIPMEHTLRDVEETSVRVFETLANRAHLLVDTLTKSPPEYWKVWSTLFPAITDFSESSPVFESVVFLFKRLGELMREADPQLTQQLMTEVGLPSVVKELARSPEKREALCEIVYSHTQEDTLNHLLVLRALKEKMGDSVSVYVSCLACLISFDASMNLLDEHLLDLYIYYALMAMQSPQPRIRVAGVSILSTITTYSTQYQAIVSLIPNFIDLASDDWWEVQAQLLQLAAHLLRKLTVPGRQEQPAGDDDEVTVNQTRIQDQEMQDTDLAMERLLNIISRLFVVSSPKNVLQVGLSSLVHLLPDYPTLLPMFVTVLLMQPQALRQRLLHPGEADQDRTESRLTYVMGNASRMYEESCLRKLWPSLEVATTLTRQVEASNLEHLEVEHLEVLLASLPDEFLEEDANEWLAIFEKVRQYIFVALVDPDLHLLSTQIIRRFFLCSCEDLAARSLKASTKTLLQALAFLYSDSDRARVEEAAMIKFLRDLRNRGGMLHIEITSVLESFKETHAAEFQASQLRTVLS